MALARHKAAGCCNRHWKRNHLFNSITESHSRLLCHWCHLESRATFLPFPSSDQTGPRTQTSSNEGASLENSRELGPDATCDAASISSLSCDEYTVYIVIELSFVTCFHSPVPGGWFKMIDQGIRHRINKAFTYPLARARGCVMAYCAVQLFSNRTLDPTQDY